MARQSSINLPQKLGTSISLMVHISHRSKVWTQNSSNLSCRSRKSDGIVFDPNILSIEENRVIMRILEEREAVALVVYTVQQINCIRDRKGEIKEVYAGLSTNLYFILQVVVVIANDYTIHIQKDCRSNGLMQFLVDVVVRV